MVSLLLLFQRLSLGSLPSNFGKLTARSVAAFEGRVRARIPTDAGSRYLENICCCHNSCGRGGRDACDAGHGMHWLVHGREQRFWAEDLPRQKPHLGCTAYKGQDCKYEANEKCSRSFFQRSGTVELRRTERRCVDVALHFELPHATAMCELALVAGALRNAWMLHLCSRRGIGQRDVWDFKIEAFSPIA